MSKNEKEETYSPERIQVVKKILENGVTNNNPFHYRIQVDGLNVVEKTSDLSKFDTYESFIPEAKEVIVFIYNSPTTPNHIIKRVFRIQDSTPPQIQPIAQGLSGVEVDNKINQAKKEWECELVKKENVELKEKLKDAESYMEKLQDEIERQKRENIEVLKKKGLKDKDFGMVWSGVAEGLIRRNTHLIAKIPGAEGLAGIIEQDNEENSNKPANEQPEGEASFSKKSEENTNLNEDEQRYLVFLKRMEDSFNEKEMEDVMGIMNSLIEKPENIKTVAELLNIKHENKQTKN